MRNKLRFSSSLVTGDPLQQALQRACGHAAEQLGAHADLAVLFLSADQADDAERLLEIARQELQPGLVLGCTAESLVGTGREIEGQTAASLWLAHLPRVRLRPMHLSFERTPEGGSIIGWDDDLIEAWPERAAMIVVADPFSFPADAMLERLNQEHPDLVVIGGMASGAAQPGDARLLLGNRVYSDGAATIMLDGPLRVRPVVSQGCRPIGHRFVITKAEGNVIYELGGKPALLQLKEVFDSLPTSEQRLVQQGLHVGRVVSEFQEHYEQGDFLVRNVIGIDPGDGAVAVGDYMRAGQTVQFHVRDAQSADGEMRQLLAQARDASGAARGALLFTCNGRGMRLFSEPHHDAGVIGELLGTIPLAGFFAAGEIGPVGGKNFVHGFTASVAMFEEEDR